MREIVNKKFIKALTPRYFSSFSKSGAGFTLIELLVVIAIIGLLASVVLVALNNSRLKARDAKRIGDMNQFAKAMELYFNDKFSYPTTTGNVSMATFGVLTGTSAACASDTAGCINYMVPGYVTKIPTSPTPADGSCATAYAGGIGNDYQIAGTGNGNNSAANYTITFCLGQSAGVLGPGIHTLTKGGMQ